jgi:CPA2 family monovalent cation:H+ antiporter-2
MTEYQLIATIVGGIVTAAVFGYLAQLVRLPALVGYLVAGIVIGPYTPGFVADVKLAKQLAEIGIILLMFGVGLHFSIPDLVRVRRVAVPGALFQMFSATALGALIAYAIGFSVSNSLVYGLALSVASTVVLLRQLEAQDLLKTHAGKIAVGWLIVEDIIMVLAIVLLPVLADMFRADNALDPERIVLEVLTV